MSDKHEEKDVRELLEKHPLLDIEKQLYYHGIRPMKEINLTKLKILSIAFVLLGLLGIYFFAAHAPVPLVKVRDVYGNFLMNYATVFVEGIVSSVPYVEVSSGGRVQVRFAINDTTGELNIYVYDPQATEALKKNLIPFPGDHVRALVQIRVRETYTYAILQSLDFLEIKRNMSEPLNVTLLTRDLANKYVRVSGTATDIREVGSGTLFEVDTGKGLVTVLWPKILDFIYKDNKNYTYLKNNLTEGAQVDIKGVVYLYRGSSPEIIPRGIDDIWVEPIIPVTTTINNISNYIGKYVKIYGVMGEINYEVGRYSVMVYNDTSRVTAMFPRNLIIELNPFETGTGSKLEIIGSVISPTNMLVIKYKVLEEYPSPLLSIGNITEALDGYTVTVKGIIRDLTITSSAVIFMLEDDTGLIKIFMPGSVYASLGVRAKLIYENASITLSGYVDIYREELEIVVYTANGVETYDYEPPGEGKPLPQLPGAPPPQPQPPPTEQPTTIVLGELGNYVGSIVTIDVYLDGIQYDYDQRLYVLEVHDDTGKAYVLSSSTPVRTAIDPFVVGCGSRIKFTGTVKSDQKYGLVVDIGSDPGNIVVVEPVAPLEVNIKDLYNMSLGVIVVLKNVSVTGFNVIGSGNWIFTAIDSTGLIKVYVPASVASNIPADIRSILESGGKVTIAGYLTTYGSQLEIVVYTSNGIIA
ncbi:MAG: hypothetical protein B6U89_00575 [Desulfurococcales archaeon ex4484_58]|nr:MAG: hypothetical protein B6U89_00575 [Desulfurococcales archaeon ex4484_58]